ncbi:phage tail protein [Pedobacter suwonensis]|uniref:phage tail protein n=1 Tax=Pedobacter suwonensis TaxID=332999 RepID=UPI00119F894A|nr:tail fiber protein [Pedobacter suwonensis]
MEGTLAEVRIFAGNFSPRTWAFCQGQLLSLSANQALFALLGTTYGGDGRTTFGLPDLRSKTVIGAGTGVGLSAYTLGQKVGIEKVTLTVSQIPAHTHQAVVTPTSGHPAATFFASPDIGTQVNGSGAFVSEDGSGQVACYSNDGSALTPLSPKSVEVTNLNIPAPTVSLLNVGGSNSHNNIMPSIALNYIICLQGIFPSRN